MILQTEVAQEYESLPKLLSNVDSNGSQKSRSFSFPDLMRYLDI